MRAGCTERGVVVLRARIAACEIDHFRTDEAAGRGPASCRS